MLGARTGGTHICYHCRLAASSEGIFQNFGELTLAVRHMVFLEGESPDALLESQQTRVDLLTLVASLAVIVHCISSSLATC